jgi:glutamine amidotransferase
LVKWHWIFFRIAAINPLDIIYYFIQPSHKIQYIRHRIYPFITIINMCRWITLISANHISLSDVVLAPSHALVHQSRDATYHPGYDAVNNAPLNADGFGVGWYHSNITNLPTMAPKVAGDGTVQTTTAPSPTTASAPTAAVVKQPPPPAEQEDPATPFRAAAVFKDVFPAWNNLNLRELCLSTSSNCIMAHVRAASPGTGISHTNCHPFKAGRLLFCHNGRVFSYQLVKRRFLSQLGDEAYACMGGTTDSECVFGLILTHLAQDGNGTAGISPVHQKTPFGHKRLASAVRKTLRQIEGLLLEAGITGGYSTCNFSLTDGDTMVVTRYCDDKDPLQEIPPPSLYFAFGDAKTLRDELTREQPLHAPLFSKGATTTTTATNNSTPKRISSLEEEKKTTEDEDGDSSSDDSDGTFRERRVSLHMQESMPGKIMEQVDPLTATFIVSSNPLTQTHCWHKMPRNSILWYTRGSHPELRLLKTMTTPASSTKK